MGCSVSKRDVKKPVKYGFISSDLQQQPSR